MGARRLVSYASAQMTMKQVDANDLIGLVGDRLIWLIGSAVLGILDRALDGPPEEIRARCLKERADTFEQMKACGWKPRSNGSSDPASPGPRVEAWAWSSAVKYAGGGARHDKPQNHGELILDEEGLSVHPDDDYYWGVIAPEKAVELARAILARFAP